MKGSEKFFSRLLPLVLVLLTAGAGFGASRAVSLFLPDYAGEVYTGKLEQGGAQAFYLDEEAQVTLFPWDRFDESQAVTLQSYVEIQGFSSPHEMIAALEADPQSWEFFFYDSPCSFLALALWQKAEALGLPASPRNWAEHIFLAELSGVPMVCLPDTPTIEGFSLGFAAGEEQVYYYKNSPAPTSPAETRLDVSRCVEEARKELPAWQAAMVQKGLFFGEEIPQQGQEIREALPEVSSLAEESSQKEREASFPEFFSPSPLPQAAKSGNALLSFLELAAGASTAWLEDPPAGDWRPLSLLNNQGAFCEKLALLLREDYSTLSRNGETLAAFSGPSGTAVFFYDEARGTVTGYSADPASFS